MATNGPGTYQVDPFWPKPLPNNWLLGEVSGVAIDSHDHVWIIQRPNSLEPADVGVDPETNEVYIADGYGNKRVIVFDADTGEYRRHWGAYGNAPDDTPPGDYDPDAPTAQQFRNPVHCVRIADDGLVYVCDRANNRIQVFQKDGTFVKEGFIAKRTLGAGSVWDLDLPTDQVLLYNADGANQKIWTLTKDDLQIVGSFGRHGRYAGQFHVVHNIVTDSQGNIYTTEVNTGQRVQKFTYEKQVSASE